MLRMIDIREWMDSSDAKVVISLIDMCHSGSRTRNQAMPRGLQITESGKVIIAACQSFQFAYDRMGMVLLLITFIQEFIAIN